jgi:hypothetical protein
MAASIFAKTATATGTLQSGRTRLKAFIVKTASSGSPQVVFKNGSGGATQLDVVFNTSDWVQVSIPDHGVIFDDECHITLTNITSITGMFG